MLRFRLILENMFSLKRVKKIGVLFLLVAVLYLFFWGNVTSLAHAGRNGEIGHQHEEELIKDCFYLKEYKRSLDDDDDDDNLYSKRRHWKNSQALFFSHEDSSDFNKFVIFDSCGYTGSLQFLNKIPIGWKVFVVNNKLDSQLASCPNCLSFTSSVQASSILKWIQESKPNETSLLYFSAMTKMAASIFAAESNSPWIYVTDKRSRVPFDTLNKIIRDHPEKGIVYRGPRSIFQPCGHFMDTFTWNGKGLLKGQSRYVLRSLPPKSLYQIVDTCYKPGMNADWQNLFDQHAPVPFVLRGKWAAVDFQNILVPRSGFWSLFASMKLVTDPSSSLSTSSSASSLLSSSSSLSRSLTSSSSGPNAVLSLLAQRLLWDTEIAVGFVQGSEYLNSDLNKNSASTTCATCDIELSMKDILSQDHGHTVNALKQWSWCPSRIKNVEDCLTKAVNTGLIKGLSFNSGSYHGSRHLEILISTWVRLLKNYRIPPGERMNSSDEKSRQNRDENEIYFTPAKSLHPNDKQGNSLPPNPFSSVCVQKGKNYSAQIPLNHPERFNSVVLVVSFNFPRFLNFIVYLEFVYGRHFKHIVYCATGLQKFQEKYVAYNKHNPVTFIDVDIGNGYFGHHCVVAAMEMNYYNVTGYLYLSDDVILNVWNLYNSPFHVPWFQTDIRIVHFERGFARGHDYGVDWYPWNKPTGKPAIRKSIRLLKSLVDDPEIGVRVRWFLKNLRQMSNGCDNCIAYMDADLYYLPSYMASDFRFFVPYFKGVFQELSVPTLLSGITPQADLNIYRLRGSYLVGAPKRNNFEKAWSPEEVFVHPVKYSGIIAGHQKSKNFYCAFTRLLDLDLKWFEHDMETKVKTG